MPNNRWHAQAERFWKEFKERLHKFGLALHPDKTPLIEFGRFAAEKRKRRGQGKPETFDFLGFTHTCGRKWPTGSSRSSERRWAKGWPPSSGKEGRAKRIRRRHEPVA